MFIGLVLILLESGGNVGLFWTIYEVIMILPIGKVHNAHFDGATFLGPFGAQNGVKSLLVCF